MKVKVLGNQTINYKGKNYQEGDIFEIQSGYYDRLKNVLQKVEDNEDEMEKTEISPEDTPDEKSPEIAEDLVMEDLSDDLTVAEMKDLLDERGIKYPAKALKDELAALLK